VRGILSWTHAKLSHFLLIYREQRRFGAMVVRAPSPADALLQAAHVGFNAPNSFRLGQEIDTELVALVRPEQVGRILSLAEAKELLALFNAGKSASIKTSGRRSYLRVAE
jgi:hypothetical protein